MTVTIGLVANIYQEANALPGWLETHTPFFDDIRVLHAGPGGEYSNDGTLEILEKWRIPVQFCAIDEGFGIVRTKALRMSPCDWVMLLDADERFYPVHRMMTCSGESTPHNEVDAILQTYDFRDLKTMIPNWENIARLGVNLHVHTDDIFDQGKRVRHLISMDSYDAIITVRRHWHNLTFKRPTQNWYTDPDWQLRLVRNSANIYFDPASRMHEQLIGATKPFRADSRFGPFFDHFHFTFKRMEQEQRAHDIAIYDKIHVGEVPPKWTEFKS